MFDVWLEELTDVSHSAMHAKVRGTGHTRRSCACFLLPPRAAVVLGAGFLAASLANGSYSAFGSRSEARLSHLSPEVQGLRATIERWKRRLRKLGLPQQTPSSLPQVMQNSLPHGANTPHPSAGVQSPALVSYGWGSLSDSCTGLLEGCSCAWRICIGY